MTPTARAAAVLAVIGAAALVVPVWLAVGLAVVVLVVVAADGITVRGTPEISREVPTALSRGVPAPLRVRASAPDHRRVLLRQAPPPGFTVVGEVGVGALDGSVTASRRGLVTLPGVASASIGPLGLARVHHRAGPAVTLRVYPDVAGARRLIVRLRRTLGGFAGGLARGPVGLGTEFESVREYTPDDDIRQLNWPATARVQRPMTNTYRVERDREVVCLLDCGRLTAAQIDRGTVLDASLDAATVLALAADELGDRFGAIAFDTEIRRVLPTRHRGGRAAVEALFDLSSSARDSDFELACAHLGRARRALVFIHTDLIDEAAARSLLGAVVVLARRHAVIVAGVADPDLTTLAQDSVTTDPAVRLAALDVLGTRSQTALRLRQAGARVLEAPPDAIADRCLQAYLRAKLRAR